MHPGFVFSLIIGTVTAFAAGENEVRFNQAIRPILSDNCYACHGPDGSHRKAKLRLDLREEAIERGAIVPGKPEESELIKRVFTEDQDELMPPAEAHKVLTKEQKELLRDWVAQGAKYEGHWAYIPPVKPATPAGKNGIDHLVNTRIESLGLTAAPEADRRTLIRRLYFDLVGLPPTPDEVEAFVNDRSADAYPALVEKLLASPHYGERMAIPWLDVVRFADTIGYHSDNPRNIWPYRDYVIRAFNENKPFDQFTIEQLAGDLLPEGTLEQKVGSAFNRLLLTTEEGGAQAKDYEARMLTDRVRAVGSVWLGQTLGCAACHDHKFDPIAQRDFYAMGAFFADIKEPIIGRREAGILVPDEREKAELARLDAELARLQEDFNGPHPEKEEAFATWEKDQVASLDYDRHWTVLKPAEARSAEGAELEPQSEGSILVKGKKPDKDTYTIAFKGSPNPVSALRLEALPHDSLPAKGSGRAGNGNFVVSEITAVIERKDGTNTPVRFSSARASIEQEFAAEGNPGKRWAASAVIDGNTEKYGWAILPDVTKPQRLVLELADPVRIEAGDKLRVEISQNHGYGNHTLGHFRLSASSSYDVARASFDTVPDEIAAILRVSAADRTSAQKEKLFSHFKAVSREFEPLRNALADARKARDEFEGSLPRCIVSVASDEPRTVRVLPRGDFLNDTGEIVAPAFPGFLVKDYPKWSGKERRLTRLDLANWLVSRDNPLTARVTMNRVWKQFFGTGLSKVLDDFGAQGEPPPNQALLDWLACEFMDSGWNLKQMVRLIVNSDTYKRSSQAPAELRERDPANRELAAQSRWRHDAELIRDNALAVADLLVAKIGGPSVKPYQPAGYWENLNFPVRTYDASQGAGQYRRGLYTWWQRSFLHPSMLAFDAPSREECVAERNRSNIPQQALILLNDPTYVEASRAFAIRILRECGGDDRARIEWAWRQMLSRVPRADEFETVEALLKSHRADYQADEDAARALLEVGQQPFPETLAPAEVAAWTSVVRVLLNLHETVTRS